MKLVTAATMREMDRRTIDDFHIPGIVLMENAALSVVRVITQRLDRKSTRLNSSHRP